MITAINRYSTQVYGFYLSGPNDFPGQILVEERGIGGSALSLSSTRGGTFQPSLTTTQVTNNSQAPNGLFYSRLGLPEAVPLLNFLKIGSADKQILSLKALRDSLFVLKEDGVYRVTEGGAGFNVELIDGDTILIAPDTVQTLTNQIICLTTQGVVQISEGGVEVLSRPIETDILTLFGAALPAVKTVSFAISYQSDRKYILYLPDSINDTYARRAYCYNVFTKAWTVWTIPATCGMVNPANDKLYLGNVGSNTLWIERKAFDYTDFADFGSTQVLSAVSSQYNLSLSGSDTVAIGDIVWQNATTFAFITAINRLTGIVTVGQNVTWTLGSVNLLKAIPIAIKWNTDTAGSPGTLKCFSEMEMFFKHKFNSIATANFSTDQAPGEVPVPLSGSQLSAWGLFAWGMAPWGGGTVERPVRATVPREHRRCTRLSLEWVHSYGYSSWSLTGVALYFDPGSQRVNRN
jgi:hypothetical protein